MTAARERWRRVEGFSRYMVSDRGRMLIVSSRRRRAPFVMSPSIRYGYATVHLTSDDGAIRRFMVHRLVLLAFVGPCPEGQETRHLNGDRLDNRLSNLAWGTSEENAADRTRHGTVLVGERNPHAKLTADLVRKIRAERAAGRNVDEMARAYGLNRRTIYHVANRESWRHVGEAS